MATWYEEAIFYHMYPRNCDYEAVVVAVNNDENAAEIEFPVPFPEKEYYNSITKEKCSVENGRIRMALGACSSIILVTKREG